MPNLTITKTISFTDPDSGSVYPISSTKVLVCDEAHRTRFTLSTAANTRLFTNSAPGLITADPQYIAIKNVGAASAYININTLGNDISHEIATDAIFEIFGEDMYGASGTGVLTFIEAKGNTEVEIDVFM